MKFHRRIRSAVLPLLVGVALSVAATGCSSDDFSKEITAMNTSNIQRVSNIYAAYQNGKGGSGPKDEADFKEFIRAYAPDKLAAMGFDPAKLDDAFKSERDGKPFKIRYKVGGGRGAVAPVVFEQDGVNGKKQVGFTGGKVEEVDEAQYTALWSGKAGTEAPGAAQGGPAGGAPKGGGRPGVGGPPPGAPTGPPGR